MTRVVFHCDNTAATREHPFGYPRHVSSDNKECVHRFVFPTVLVCTDLYETEKISEPDSCIIHHQGLNKFINISELVRPQPYIVTVPGLFDETNHYEIEPCGKLVSSCGGAVCHVSKTVKESLGHLTSMIYDENLDAIKVDYKEVTKCL